MRFDNPEFWTAVLVMVFAWIAVRRTACRPTPTDSARLARLEAKVDLLLREMGLEYDPLTDVPEEVIEAVRAGRKIEAIKLYRSATGVGLKDAKDFVDQLPTHLPTLRV